MVSLSCGDRMHVFISVSWKGQPPPFSPCMFGVKGGGNNGIYGDEFGHNRLEKS